MSYPFLSHILQHAPAVSITAIFATSLTRTPKVTRPSRNDNVSIDFTSERFIIEPSYVFCKNLIDGRLSYQGMNPTIEDLMQKEENAELARLEKEKEADVSDEQMTDYWKGMKKKNEYKYEKQRRYGQQDEPPSKKPKFLKPQD